MLRYRIDDNLISLYEERSAFLTVQRYQATTRCLQLSNLFVFIFSVSCNALHLERNQVSQWVEGNLWHGLHQNDWSSNSLQKPMLVTGGQTLGHQTVEETN